MQTPTIQPGARVRGTYQRTTTDRYGAQSISAPEGFHGQVIDVEAGMALVVGTIGAVRVPVDALREVTR